MRKRTPLTYEDVKQLIVGKNGLAEELHKLIVERNESASNSIVLAVKTLKYDVATERLRGGIADVVRRYNIDCPACQEREGNDYHERILCDWHLVDCETLLKCHKCEYYIEIELHNNKNKIKELISLAPVPVLSLFKPERE